jgi:hypothetical protein
MNQNNIFTNSQNTQPLIKKPEETDSFLVPNQHETKIISPIPEHSINFPFKVVQGEKESHISNNFLLINNDKGGKSNGKNINIIKPKFVTKTITNENTKIKLVEENPSLNLTLNLSGSAFQPQIIKENKDNKEFRTKVNNKIFNLILDNKNDNFKLELHQINDNVYSLKYFYENNFSLADLKLLNKFFCLFDNVADMMVELEKWLIQNQYTVLEDLDNKIAKIQIKVPILQMYENVELTLTQKAYSKENLFEILCKKVSNMSKEYEFKINKLENDNKFLIVNLFNLMNRLNPMNMNYPMNQRENIRNLNNININQNNNINNMNRAFNSNNINMNKNIALIKKTHLKPNIEMKNKLINFDFNKEKKYDENKENHINIDELNDISNESNSFNDENIFNGEKRDKLRLNKKRGRGRKTSYSSNKNNSLSQNKNCSNDIFDTNNNNVVIKNNIELNYNILKDIKAKRINKVKGLYDIINSPDELYMIVNKILYKYCKYKKNNNTINYENKYSFCLINLFDSSIHGDSAEAFHNRCDYKFNTISLIETNSGHRFGGYTSECFESPNNYFDKKDNLSFVFSLDKMRTYDVIKGKYAISCDKGYGPYFRDDHICIVDEFFSKESGTCIKGKGFSTLKNYELNSGKKYFTVKRLQVFQIKIKKIK